MGPNPGFASIIKKAVVEANKENEVRDERIKNVIIFGAEESSNPSRDERMKQDKELIKGLFNEIGLSPVPAFDEVLRLGRWNAQTRNGKRPLRFRMESEEAKGKLMESLVNLREADEKYKALSIKHDLTIEQREDLKIMVNEAKTLTEAENDGHFLYRVRCSPGAHWRPKIVKLKSRRGVPTANPP